MMRWSGMAGLGLSALAWAAFGTASAAPLKTPVVGPQLLCFKYSTFSLLDGERVTDFSGGAEAMTLAIGGPSGAYTVSESGIFAARGARRLELSSAKTNVYRFFEGGPRYGVYGPTSFSDGEDRPIIWLSGAALKGTAADAAIFSRVEVRDPKSVKCDQSFSYRWFFE